jgi:mono/diheme cytochrome c family protein
MKAVRRLVFGAVAIAVALVVAGLVYPIAGRGLGTRGTPSMLERLAARAMRRAATPGAVHAMRNPVAPSDAVLAEGLAHFADHCALCHANDGSGQTEIGRGLYPPAPDMRAADTQQRSDGELFAAIEDGIRLTGMPAWGTGTPEGRRASWVLVTFIRHLPKLTDDELARMEALNPKTADEWREDEAGRRFLAGEDDPAPVRHDAGRH